MSSNTRETLVARIDDSIAETLKQSKRADELLAALPAPASVPTEEPRPPFANLPTFDGMRNGEIVQLDADTFAAELHVFAESRGARSDSASLMLSLASQAFDELLQFVRRQPKALLAAAPEARPADPNLQSPEGAQFEEDHLGVVRDDSCPEATDGRHVYNLVDWHNHEVVGRTCYKCGDKQSLAGAPALRAPQD